MSEQNTTDTQDIFADVASDTTKEITEKAIDRLLNGVLDFVDTKYKHAKISLGTVFKEYLNNAYKRYNSVTTLVNRYDPRPIIGKNNMYIHANLLYQGCTIETQSVKPLLKISNNILICGTGGIGKTMMLRYFFLNEIEHGNMIPILLTLRRLNSIASDNISIVDLAYMCLDDFNVKLPRNQFEYSLEKGVYLFLLDGFDEVAEVKASKVAEKIQKFSAKYPKNKYIITSRPGFDFTPFETYTQVKTGSLSINQALSLASKFANFDEEDKVKEFCEQLRLYYFHEYYSFASVPLLLSMMYLTFLDNGNIPNNLAEFYERTFDALINTHDNFKKPITFKREFKCKELDRRTFKMIFAHFCYRSFFETNEKGYLNSSNIESVYEFSPTDIEKRLAVSIKRIGAGVSTDDYLLDLQRIVCLIVLDGSLYRFVHRSFQDYFAAVYTEQLDDDKQKVVFSRTRYECKYNDYYKILYSIQKDRLIKNGFLEELKDFIPILKVNNLKDAWREHFFSNVLKSTKWGFFALIRNGTTCVDKIMASIFDIPNYDYLYENDDLNDIRVDYKEGECVTMDYSCEGFKEKYPCLDWDAIREDIANSMSFEKLASIVLAWDEEYNTEKEVSEDCFPD